MGNICEEPKYPSTGFGYIQVDHNTKGLSYYDVLKFEEKPNLKKAKTFMNDHYFWNCGIFMGNTKMIINSIKKNAPTVASCI